jgi:two-component system OmpR family response regulator
MLTREVRRGGVKIDLQPLEYSLLEYLMRNAGRVVSKTMIMEHVWDYHFDPQTNVVEARICRLRDKVDKGVRRQTDPYGPRGGVCPSPEWLSCPGPSRSG